MNQMHLLDPSDLLRENLLNLVHLVNLLDLVSAARGYLRPR